MRLAAGAAVGGAAYQAGKRRAGQDLVDQPEHEAFDATVGPTGTPAGGAGTAEQLERLAQLHASGALGDDEFTAAKAKVLGR